MKIQRLNQNNHVYVVSAYKSGVTSADDMGTIEVKSTADKKEVYFKYVDAGGLLRSDLIPVTTVTQAKAVDAKTMQVHHKAYSVAIDKAKLPKDVDGAAIVKESELILEINFRGFMTGADDDFYHVWATPASASDEDVAKALFKATHNKNTDNAVDVYLNGKIIESVTGDAIVYGKETSDTKTGVVVAASEPGWVRGKGGNKPVDFFIRAIENVDVLDNLSMKNGSNFEFKIDQDGESTFIDGAVTVKRLADILTGNGKAMADLEWSLSGERGDNYHLAGWPDNIDTVMQVDPSKEYHAFNIHFAFTDDGTSSYRSEKDITIISADKATLNSVVSNFASESGLTVSQLA